MNDDRLEGLLRGYSLPEVSRDLDRRVLHEAGAILAHAEPRNVPATLEDVVVSLLDGLGFGYLPWLVDWVRTTDAEYRVVVF